MFKYTFNRLFKAWIVFSALENPWVCWILQFPSKVHRLDSLKQFLSYSNFFAQSNYSKYCPLKFDEEPGDKNQFSRKLPKRIFFHNWGISWQISFKFGLKYSV